MFLFLNRNQRLWMLKAISACLCLCLHASACAQRLTDLTLTFKPRTQCAMPPTAPPKALLHKKYKVGNLTDNVFVFDINGDGICDWLRGGFSVSRYDQIERLPIKNFVFIGTKKGWRAGGANDKSQNKVDLKELEKKWLGWWSPVAAFVYEEGSLKPYIVFHGDLDDAWHHYLARDSYLIYRWDEKADFLVAVDDSTRETVLKFLAQEICASKPKNSLDEDFVRFLGGPDPDALCKPQDGAVTR